NSPVTVNAEGRFAVELKALDAVAASQVEVVAIDSAGRLATASVGIVIDQEPPTIGFDAPSTVLMASDDDTFAYKIVASEPISAGVFRIGAIDFPLRDWRFSNDGKTWETTGKCLAGSVRDALPATQNRAVIWVSAQDAAGNWGVSTGSVTVVRAVPKPTVDILERNLSGVSPLQIGLGFGGLESVLNQYPDAQVRLELIRRDFDSVTRQDVETVIAPLGSRPPQVGTVSVSVPISPDWTDGDRYAVRASVWIAGNNRYMARYPTSAALIIQNRPFSFNGIQLRTSYAGPNQPIQFEIDGTPTIKEAGYVLVGNGGVEYPVATSSILLKQLPVPNGLKDGDYRLQIRVTALSGVVASGSYPIAIDRRPPVAVVAKGDVVFKPFDASTMTLQTSADEPVSGETVRISVSGNPVQCLPVRIEQTSDRTVSLAWTGKASPIQILESGIYTVELALVDLAGNRTTVNWQVNQIN
ncbi:hypothetical protein EBR96_09545, partial [bacterium]|nr:hypothetical protein [bacterium]